MTEQYKPKHFAILDYLNSQDTLKAFRSGSGGEFPDTPDSDTSKNLTIRRKGKHHFTHTNQDYRLVRNGYDDVWVCFLYCRV